jgi:hypothetical protein
MRKVLTILTLGLTACGGGGSTGTSSTSSSAPQNLQMAPAPAQVLSPTYSLTNLTATDSSGNVFYLAISDTADAGTASFDGQMANYNTLGVAITENTNPNPVLSRGAVAFYLTSPYSPLGEEITQNGVIVETALLPPFTPPSSLTVGDSGQLDAISYYNTSNVLIGNATQTYSVAANNATTVLVTLTTTGTVNGTELRSGNLHRGHQRQRRVAVVHADGEWRGTEVYEQLKVSKSRATYRAI